MLNPNKANLSAYADPTPTKPPKRSIRERIIPQEVRLETLTTQLKDLESEFKASRISHPEYISLKSILDKKYARAWTLYEKAMGWSDKEDYSKSVEKYLTTYSQNTRIKNKEERILPNVGNVIIDGLSNDNCIRVWYVRATEIVRFVGRITHQIAKLG